jgi:hypothetical protein
MGNWQGENKNILTTDLLRFSRIIFLPPQIKSGTGSKREILERRFWLKKEKN